MTRLFINYSRPGRKDSSFEQIGLNDILAETLASLNFVLKGENIELQIAKNLPTIQYDRVHVLKIYSTLISNAAFYNEKANKLIEIGWEAQNDFCNDTSRWNKQSQQVFYVRDNGSGTGAGLTIVKKIIERHGGHIRVKSELGIGSTFYFTLNQTPKLTPADSGKKLSAEMKRSDQNKSIGSELAIDF